MKVPNFFIVGAPRCGTTALYEYLREHPNIYLPWLKEPHYFAGEIPKSRARPYTSLDIYLNECFDKVNEGHLVAGEASSMYLSSPCALKNIQKFNSDAKIIVMLRNPVDAVISFHTMLFSVLEEDEKDVEIAWSLQSQRNEGLSVPKTSTVPRVLQYKNVFKYGDQLEQLFKIFPKKQVKIVIFDDFKKDLKSVYEDMISFLGVPSDGRSHFPVVNESRSVVNRRLACLIHEKGPLGGLTKITDRIKKMLNKSNLHIREKLITGKFSPANVTQEFKLCLASEFRSDIEKTSCMLGRDLRYWVSAEFFYSEDVFEARYRQNWL